MTSKSPHCVAILRTSHKVTVMGGPSQNIENVS